MSDANEVATFNCDNFLTVGVFGASQLAWRKFNETSIYPQSKQTSLDAENNCAARVAVLHKNYI